MEEPGRVWSRALGYGRAAAWRPVPLQYLPAEGQVQSRGLLIADGCRVVCASGRAVLRAGAAGFLLAQQPLFVLPGTSWQLLGTGGLPWPWRGLRVSSELQSASAQSTRRVTGSRASWDLSRGAQKSFCTRCSWLAVVKMERRVVIPFSASTRCNLSCCSWFVLKSLVDSLCYLKKKKT